MLYSATFLSPYRPLIVLAALAAGGCNTNPTQGKAQAEVKEAVNSAPKPQAGTAFAFSEDGSKFGWVGAKVTNKHDGGFNKFSGTIRLPDGKAEGGSVSVEVDTTSVFSDNEKLTGHLKSPDFFDTAKFPKATFNSTAVTPGASGAGAPADATHTVTGNLELHGVTKSISFPAKIRISEGEVSVDAEFGLNRKDFGILYTGKADDLIRDEVLIKLAIRAKKTG